MSSWWELALLAAILAGAGLYYLYRWNRDVRPRHMAVRLIPEAVERLTATGKEDAYVSFLFAPRGKLELDLDFSWLDGRIGLDWWTTEPNRPEFDRLAAFIERKGHTVKREIDDDGSSYLRVEDGDLGRLGLQIVTELYGLSSDQMIDFYKGGFEWKPRAR
jgi:hypothetical protein